MLSLNNLSDSELFVLLKKGDSTAYAEIYDRYSLMLLNHAYNKTRDREEAKDIVQEVFASLWAGRETLMLAKSLPAYLFTCVRNTFLNQIHRKNIQEKYLQSISTFATQNQVVTDHRVRQRMFEGIIEREINNLPPKTGEVFRLSRHGYLSHKEIAERLGISEQTVSKHITNALKVLRVKLGVFLYLLLLFYK